MHLNKVYKIVNNRRYIILIFDIVVQIFFFVNLVLIGSCREQCTLVTTVTLAPGILLGMLAKWMFYLIQYSISNSLYRMWLLSLLFFRIAILLAPRRWCYGQITNWVIAKWTVGGTSWSQTSYERRFTFHTSTQNSYSRVYYLTNVTLIKNFRFVVDSAHIGYIGGVLGLICNWLYQVSGARCYFVRFYHNFLYSMQS